MLMGPESFSLASPLMPPSTNPSWVQSSVQDSAWDQVSPSTYQALYKVLGHALQGFSYPLARVELSVVFTNNSQIQILNRDYRGQDKPTNVLSFPQEELKKGTYCPGTETVLLGDIVFAYEKIREESAVERITFEHHLCHLGLHGLLHLLGFNHETSSQAWEMESIEIKILGENGIDSPYASREAGNPS